MTNEQLVACIQAHENEAENMLELWKQNKGFIYTMAMKFRGCAEVEDLLQEGYIGLCYAVQHFNSEQYTSFIHYAAFWIKQVMIRYIADCCHNIRIPVNTRNEILQYKKIYSEYRKYYGKEPTDREMRAFLGVSIEKLEIIKKNSLAVTIRSLNEPLGDEEELVLGDTVASDQDMEEDVIKKLDAAAMKESLWKAVDNLDYDMAAVIRKRYQDKMTLKEVGESMGVSTERARQVEKNAMRKLRIPSRCAPFKCYFEQYLAAGPIHHVGVNKFNRTWTSSVEAEVLFVVE